LFITEGPAHLEFPVNAEAEMGLNTYTYIISVEAFRLLPNTTLNLTLNIYSLLLYLLFTLLLFYYCFIILLLLYFIYFILLYYLCLLYYCVTFISICVTLFRESTPAIYIYRFNLILLNIFYIFLYYLYI
jgi:hypothetical protein